MAMSHDVAFPPAADPGLAPSALFNGYVGASVVYALDELGALEALGSGDRLDADDLAARLAVDPVLLRSLLLAAGALGYAEVDQRHVRLTGAGHRLLPLSGYFTWLVGGYGAVLRDLAALARGHHVFGVDVNRDEARVAAGAGANDRAFMAPLLHGVLDELSFASFADLGCGAGGRLIDVCRRYPGASGVGIDISPEACALAEANVARARLGDRIRIVCADVRDLPAAAPGDDDLAQVDVVGSFFMLHDLLQGEGASSGVFGGLKRSFPRARHYVVADTTTMPTGAAEPPIFSLGYELVHAFMGVRLYARAEYDRLFEHSGLSVKRCIPFGTPNSWLYVLERPA